MNVINKTPHDVVLFTHNQIVTYKKSDKPFRLNEFYVSFSDIPFPIFEVTYEHNELPPESNGTIYIVSQLVAAAFPNRKDLVYPIKFVRDDAGKILGCQAFGIFL